MLRPRRVLLPGDPLVHGTDNQVSKTYCGKSLDGEKPAHGEVTCPRCAARMDEVRKGLAGPLGALDAIGGGSKLRSWATSRRR